MEENNEIIQNDVASSEQTILNTGNNGNGSKKGLVIIIGVLILIIAGLLVYMFVIKGDEKESSKDNNNSSQNTNNNNANNNNDDNNKTDNNQTNNNTNATVTNEDVENIIALMHKYYLFNLIYEGNSSTFDKANVTTGQLLGFYAYKASNDGSFSATKEDADDYFMKAYNFKPDTYKDITCLIDNESMYNYDNSELAWKKSDYEHGHGGWSNDFEDYYVVDKSINDNKISLDLIFMYYGEFTFDTYINGTSVSMGSEIDYDHYMGGDEQLHDELYSKQKEYFQKHVNEYTNGKIYNFVFEKDGNNYYLKSFKVKE